MKRIFIALMVCGAVGGMAPAMAQQKVIPAQAPTIVMGGDFNSGGDTAVHTYNASVMPLYTGLDTVVLAASAGDSARIKLPGEYNSVTLEVHPTIYTGTACDSVVVQFWGTATQGNGQGAFKLLQTTTLGTGTAEQVITYIPNSGVGNTWTNYRVTVDVADLAGNCKVSWRAWALVR